MATTANTATDTEIHRKVTHSLTHTHSYVLTVDGLRSLTLCQ